MYLLKVVIVTVSLLLVLLSGCTSDELNPSAYFHDRVETLVAQWGTATSPGAAVGIFEDGEVIYAGGYGLASLEYAVPMTSRSVLRIGSISKQFVAMCVAILAEQGELSFDDDIRMYLPEMPDYGGPIRVRHLLHHTSGIREYLVLVSLIGKPEGSIFGYTSSELLRLLSQQKALNFVPGERFSYSNSGYFLLAEIVARVSGTKASTFARENIFQPLGMSSTRFYDEPNAIVPNLAFGYSETREGLLQLDILRSDVVGDLGVITTVEDFVRWDRNFDHNVLGAGGGHLIETMLRPGSTNNGETLSYALGLEHGSYRGLRTVGHTGSAVGYVSAYIRLPDQRFSVVVFSNLSTSRPSQRAREIVDLYLADELEPAMPTSSPDRPARSQPTAVTKSTEELKVYAGDYYSDELSFFYTLSAVEDHLELELRGQRHKLITLPDERFAWRRAELHFVRDRRGRVTSFTIDAGEVQGIRFRRVSSQIPPATPS